MALRLLALGFTDKAEMLECKPGWELVTLPVPGQQVGNATCPDQAVLPWEALGPGLPLWSRLGAYLKTGLSMMLQYFHPATAWCFSYLGVLEGKKFPVALRVLLAGPRIKSP